MTFPHCPHCNVEMKELQAPEKALPRRGDLVVCYRCGKPARWEGEMELRRLNPGDIQELPKQSKAMLMATMVAVAQHNAERN